jgi:hypothetical protein
VASRNTSQARVGRYTSGDSAKSNTVRDGESYEHHIVRTLVALEAGVRQLALVLEEIRRPLVELRASAFLPSVPRITEAAEPRKSRQGKMTTKRLNALIEERRTQFEPSEVRLLFVASPPDPTDPTNFYLANSHLFRCMRGAFAKAFGPMVPAGEDFLGYFRDSGGWIVVLPAVLRRGRGRPSGRTLSVETAFVARVMRQTKTEHVVAFRESLGQAVKAAAKSVGLPGDQVYVLATPTDVLKDSFVTTLRTVMSSSARATVSSRELLRAVTDILDSRGNRPSRMYEIAAEIGSSKDNGTSVETKEISSLVRRHPEIFERSPMGVRLASSSPSQASRRRRGEGASKAPKTVRPRRRKSRAGSAK